MPKSRKISSPPTSPTTFPPPLTFQNPNSQDAIRLYAKPLKQLGEDGPISSKQHETLFSNIETVCSLNEYVGFCTCPRGPTFLYLFIYLFYLSFSLFLSFFLSFFLPFYLSHYLSFIFFSFFLVQPLLLCKV